MIKNRNVFECIIRQGDMLGNRAIYDSFVKFYKKHTIVCIFYVLKGDRLCDIVYHVFIWAKFNRRYIL